MNVALVKKENESEENQASQQDLSNWSGGKKREAAAKVSKCNSSNRQTLRTLVLRFQILGSGLSQGCIKVFIREHAGIVIVSLVPGPSSRDSVRIEWLINE